MKLSRLFDLVPGRSWRLAGALATAVAALALAAGCVEFEEAFVIRADGGGAVTLHYSVDEQLLAAQADAQRVAEGAQAGAKVTSPAEQLNWILNEERARAWFTEEGVRLQRYTAASRNGRRTVTIECTVENFPKALASGKFGAFSIVKTEKGPFRLHADLPQGAPVTDPAQLERLKALTKGMRLQFSVQAPGKILTAPGAEVAGRTARWVFDPAKNDACLKNPPAIDLTYDEKP